MYMILLNNVARVMCLEVEKCNFYISEFKDLLFVYCLWLWVLEVIFVIIRSELSSGLEVIETLVGC